MSKTAVNSIKYHSFFWANNNWKLNKKIVNSCLVIANSRRLKLGDFYTIARCLGQNVKHNGIRFCEMKAYMCLFRLNLASCIISAKHLIRHHIAFINDKSTNLSNYNTSTGDILSITKDWVKLLLIHCKNSTKKATIHVHSNYNLLCFIIMFFPQYSYYPILDFLQNCK
jgi:ribosomal protein S4